MYKYHIETTIYILSRVLPLGLIFSIHNRLHGILGYTSRFQEHDVVDVPLIRDFHAS